ncbi:MAG TPA: S53 family serine peptidase [Verrucomicrobiae bacterium]|nr:S53 family serine peptidase [Verrucomicrobiae bacterium]
MNDANRWLPVLLCAALQTACSGSRAIPPAQAPAAASLGAAATQAGIVATVPDLERLGVRDAGPAARSTVLSLAITLRYRDLARLEALVAQQTDPGSSHYRAWLSDAQFNARFAPTQRVYDGVAQALRGAGFQIDRIYGDRTVLDASAPVAVIDRFFRTSIHGVAGARQGAAFVNVEPARAPAALAATLLSVDGLDTVISVHAPYATFAQSPAHHARALTAAPAEGKLFGPVSSATGGRGYGPLAFSTAYDLPVVHAAPTGRYDGSGRASGIVIDADFAEGDLRQFLAYFGIARKGPPTKRVLVNGGPPHGDAGGDSVEAALDAETIVGNAPGTALSVYEIPSLKNAQITDAYNTVVSDNVVDTLNSSFGGCEAGVGASTLKAWNAITMQAASKGITFHASSGDIGGDLCVNAPATLPYVVAVGGTALNVGSGGAWFSEVGWSGSGGGTSSLFALPAWQSGVAGIDPRGRNVPDVALDADPYTGAAYFYEGTWNSEYNPIGGTSLSSPIYGAAITEIDQVKKGRVGLGGRSLYSLWSKYGYGSGSSAYFHDIVQGNSGAFYCTTGYDLVTGIGSVDFWNLAGTI